MNNLVVYKPVDSQFNRKTVNKGWMIHFPMTQQQLYDWSPRMSDAAVVVPQADGSLRIYDDFDTFNAYKSDLIKEKVLGPSKVITQSYKDINTILSHKRRVESKVSAYLLKNSADYRAAQTEKTNVTFYVHEDSRGLKNPVPMAVVLFVADEQLYNALPDDSPTFYTKHGMAAILLSNEQYEDAKEGLFTEYQFGQFRTSFIHNDLEIFKGATVKAKSEFIAPKTKQDAFYVTSNDSKTFLVSHRTQTGLQSEYGEGLAYQEVQITGEDGISALTYDELNSQYRPATRAEVEKYKTQSVAPTVESETTFARGSLGELIDSARAKVVKKEVFKTAEGGYKLKRVPSKIEQHWTKTQGDVFAFAREDMIRALKMVPTFPMPDPNTTRISEAKIWFDAEGVKTLIENLRKVPDINDLSKTVVPDVKNTGMSAGTEFKKSVPFDPHFLQLNSLAPGATVNVDGKPAIFEQYTDVKNPDDFLLRLVSKDKATGITSDIILPNSLVPEAGVLNIGSDIYEVTKPNPGVRSALEVTFADGDKAWFASGDFHNRVTPPTANVNPMHSTKLSKLFSVETSPDIAIDSGQRQVDMSEVMDILDEGLEQDEKDFYNDRLEEAGTVVRRSRGANVAELEDAGQMALFDSAEDTLKVHGKLVMSKAETFKQKASEYLTGKQSKLQLSMPSN